MIRLAQALDAYPRALRVLPARPRRLASALGCVLAQDVRAAVDLPLFTQSAVDGYALRSADSDGSLRLVGEIPAGTPADRALQPGTAMRILTGGRLPEGADAVARQEIVVREGDSLRLRQPIGPGADVRLCGEELRQGERIAAAGQRLHAGLLAALAMAGIQEVRAHRRARVAILVTGDEVAAAGAALADGQVHDANGPLVQGWLLERGFDAPPPVYVADRREAVADALARALDRADLVLSTGGVSVGDRDYVPAIAESLGVQRVFWNVAQMPGKPLWFGVRGRKALLAMPGNPAAVLVGLSVHAACVLAALEGEQAPAPGWRNGILEADAKTDARRDRLVRMSLRYADDGRAVLTALPRQGSHMLSNLAAATALAWLPSGDRPLAAGAGVRWMPLGPR